MKRVLLIAIAALAFAPAAAAHPLGNFTINHFSRVQVSGHQIYVRYVVDMAEIPTLQKVPLSTKGLALSVGGVSVPLRVVRTALAHPLGAAGLHTTRFQAILVGPAISGSARIAYRDDSYPGRIGWKEVVVGAHTASDKRRAALVPEGPPLEPARHPLGQRDAHAHERPAADLAERQGAPGTGPRLGLRIREPDRTRRPLVPRHPRLTRRRALLGRRACALSGARQDDRHRLSGRQPRHAAPCSAARPDHDDHAHDRGVRVGRRHAGAVGVHRPRPALPVDQRPVGGARRHRRPRGAHRPLALGARAQA